ncbi:alpha/beta hydrolase [Marinivivus vitaminiproducens]|uniref:alpha/beta hydrolase n=1 Tax=Marinivivus vitaminiproducens TaxID=3035935 RepID=UPI0027AA5275|nr:hypothetical protein P4R82_17580 [Geminicoccaceae bacterium SCSIO 64248]
MAAALRRFGALLGLLGVLAAPPAEAAYDYPFTNPFEATVLGTPPQQRFVPQGPIPSVEREITVFPDRDVPGPFWFMRGLNYTEALQDHAAPLIFLIAGTGSTHNAAKSLGLQAAFYEAGYHAITLPSPTSPNFIVTASTTAIPGDLTQDARDLLRVMRLIRDDVAARVPVGPISVAGYSLGGANALFVSREDEATRDFRFQRVLLINPPVSLYNSTRILDHLLDDALANGDDTVEQMLDRVIRAIADVYAANPNVEISEDLLFSAYQRLAPQREQLGALIGFVFRLLSTNMLFAADVMTNRGYIVPKNRELTAFSPLTQYFVVGNTVPFGDYIQDVFLPAQQKLNVGITFDKLVQEQTVSSLAAYVRAQPKIGLVTNADDIILEPGEIDQLRDMFGDRATIFPTGGHIGNTLHRDVVAAIVRFIDQ